MPHDVVQVPGSSLAFLRWRRLISPLTAVTINCAFVSPSSRLLSNSATTSCGKRALSCCDLLLVEPVAITGSPCVRCDSVYAKKMIIKDLKCDSLEGRFKSKGAIHLVYAKPDSAGTLNGLLTNPEFSREVLIRHDSDNQLSSCPLAWFKQRYKRLFDAPLFKSSPDPAGGSGSGPLTLHPSVVFTRWRERSIRRSAEPDDSHYSKFL
ncbi:hypothetical protein AYC70_16315 [Salmonella enterica]|nr:hypothetical protein [Salmonella enterica]EBQ0859058.1 hypothetical protein [Salmonella enterica]